MTPANSGSDGSNAIVRKALRPSWISRARMEGSIQCSVSRALSSEVFPSDAVIGLPVGACKRRHPPAHAFLWSSRQRIVNHRSFYGAARREISLFLHGVDVVPAILTDLGLAAGPSQLHVCVVVFRSARHAD